jgi:hypothetical protein
MEVAMRKSLKVLSLAALVVGGGTAASAEVVCNQEGDCWRVPERYEYRPELRLRVYPDTWRWDERDNARYRWREAPSDRRGYWRQGAWVELND